MQNLSDSLSCLSTLQSFSLFTQHSNYLILFIACLGNFLHSHIKQKIILQGWWFFIIFCENCAFWSFFKLSLSHQKGKTLSITHLGLPKPVFVVTNFCKHRSRSVSSAASGVPAYRIGYIPNVPYFSHQTCLQLLPWLLLLSAIICALHEAVLQSRIAVHY